MKRILLLMTGLLMAQTMTLAQDSEVLYPSSFAITKPLRELIKEQPYFPSRDSLKKESPDRANRRHQTFLYTAADGPEYGNDISVHQTTMGTRDISNRAPLTGWAGNVGAYRPNDPTGAASPNHYIQIVNATPVRVFSKTGTVVSTFTLGNLWSPAVSNNGDPIVMYDKYADRWFLSQFGSSTDRKIYIAISVTNDPLGSYYTYTYTSPQFPDYLKFSIWENGYYMTSNQLTDKVYCFERTEMLAGNPSARAIYQTFTTGSVGGFFVPLPADASDGGLPPAGTPLPFFAYYENSWGTGVDGVKIWNMTVTWGTTPVATITGPTQINTAAFDGTYDAGWNDCPQPGTSAMLDGIGGIPTYRAQWRPWTGYNTVLLNWGVLITNSPRQRSIRWCELRQDQGTGTWSLYQEGTYTPDGDTRWMGSMAMDDNGSIALCYTKSNSSSVYPGLYYTGRLAGDPLGQMTITEQTAKAGTSVQTSTNRIGDYSHTALDPDGVTFWHTGEYISSGVKTWIYSFQIPLPTLPPVANFTVNTTNPDCSSQVQFTDQSTNSPNTWLWDFGDGQTSSLQNPSHTYASNGTYTVTLTATNGNGSDAEVKTSYITISNPVAPTTTGASRCGSGTLTLSASGSGTIFWFDALTGGSQLGTGNTFTTPVISSTTNYYAENHLVYPSQFVGPVATGSNNTTASYLIFDAYAPCVLVSVEVYASAAGNRTIVLQNSSGATLQTTTVAIPAGSSRVNLNFNIPVGTGLRLYTGAGANLYRKTTGVAYPYTLAGYVSITGCSAGASRYTFFFDWEIRKPDCVASPRTTAVATIQPTVTPAVSVSASATTICAGTSVTFTATPANGGTPTYQWLINGSPTGSNSNTYTSSTLVNSDVISCQMTSTANCASPTTVTSNTVNMIVNPAVTPAVSIAASDASICAGENVVFTATPVNGGTPSYQWKLNSADVGSNSNTYSNSSLADGDVVHCVMSSTAPCAAPVTATSNNISMAVGTTLIPSVSISASSTVICAGTNVVFTASPVNGGLPSYQWFLNSNPVGSNSNTYSNNALSNGDVVSCSMTSSETCAVPASASSNSISVTVTTTVLPAVTISASDETICAGTAVLFTAAPVNGGTPSYQWYLNSAPVGLNSATYSNSSLVDGDQVTCMMTSSESCANPVNANSNVITLGVTPTVVPAVSINASAISFCAGDNITFTAVPVNGGAPSYQWSINGSNAGTNSFQFVTSGLADGDVVACMMTSSESCASPILVSSNNITVSVIPPVIPTVLITPSDNNVCTGTVVSFTAIPTNGGSPGYEWMVNGSPVFSGSDVYSVSTLADGDVITVNMTSSATCASPATVGSNAVTMNILPTVLPAVVISSMPTGPVCPGITKVFTANPTYGGSNPSFAWTVDGSPAGTGSTLSGIFTDGQVVFCTMTSDEACADPLVVNSTPVTVSIFIVTPVVVTENNGVLQSSAVNGNQWYEQGGGMIAGATDQTFTPLFNGNYYTIVTDTNGCTSVSNSFNITTVGIQEPGNHVFSVVPNPTDGYLTVSFLSPVNNAELSIENILGEKVWIKRITQTAGSAMGIDLSPYASGVYFLIIREGQTEIKQKIVLDKK